MKRRALVFVVLVGLVAGACTSGPTLSEYATEVELSVQAMNNRLDEIDVIFDAEVETLPHIRTYADDRM